MESQLLITFTTGKKLDETLVEIQNAYKLLYDKIFILQDEENEKEVIRAVYVEKKLGHRILTFSDLFNGLETGKADAPERVVPVDGDIAFIQFTSGSTGNPKGIMVSYKNLLTNIYDIWTRLRVDPDCLRAATWLPLYHDMGLVGFLLGCLFTTTELVLLSPQQFAKHPVQFLTLITDYKIEICGMPNFAMEWILRRFDPEDRNEFDLGSLKWIGIGAEPINMEKLRLFEDAFSRFGLKKGVLSPCYGLAEATLAVSIANPLEEYKVYRFNNILYPTNGKVLGDMEVKIEKQNNGDDFGLIKIKGNNVAEKAIINGKITGICDTNGFYNTMDIGLFLDDKLVVLGRYDDMFIVNGENFFPYEIESYIKNLKAVSRNRVVCFDVPASISPTGFTELILLYETPKLPVIEKAAMELEIDKTILKNTGLKLSKIIGVEPKTILVTPSGKIQRGLIRKRYLEGSLLK